MAASRDARIACIPVLLALVLLVVGMQPSVANAQVSDRPGQGPDMNHRQLRSPDASTRLPSWAEPKGPDRRNRFPGTGSDPGIGASSQDETAPPPPAVPPQVPVDGGLSLLALAGAGYAARKLRQSSDEEDEVDRDDAV
jgi:hypothetical protein